MADKYQRALMKLKGDKTWQYVADKLTDALGETVYRSDAWNVAKGRSSSQKVEKALEKGGWVNKPRKRYRLAVEFENEKERQEFKDFYGIDSEFITFTDWILLKWTMDKFLEDRVLKLNQNFK